MDSILPTYDGELFNSVIIDGSNVLDATREKNEKRYDVERLRKTIQAVEALGWKTMVCMKLGTFDAAMGKWKGVSSNLTDNQKKVLQQMVDVKEITLIERKESDPKSIDDIIMIRYALEKNSWILSNDQFRSEKKSLQSENHLKEINELNKRHVNLRWGPGNSPIFTLPRNNSSYEITKIVSDTLSRKLDDLSRGCNLLVNDSEGLELEVLLPLREPLGRKQLILAGIPEAHPSLNKISRSHFKLDWDGTSFYITDLGSTNGTYQSGMKLPANSPEPMLDSTVFWIANRFSLKIKVDY